MKFLSYILFLLFLLTNNISNAAPDAENMNRDQIAQVRPNDARWQGLVREAFDRRNMDATYILATELVEDRALDRGLRQMGFRLLEQVALTPHPEAAYMVANLYMDQQGGFYNRGQASVFYDVAAFCGHLDAQVDYALMLQDERNPEYNIPLALDYFKMAADQDDLYSIMEVAYILKDGPEDVQDMAGAREYFSRAFGEFGQLDAHKELAEMYHKGIGGAVDLGRACSLYKLLADDADLDVATAASAAIQYAELSIEGHGGDVAPEEIIFYLERSLPINADAYFVLGRLYEGGRLVEKNLERAFLMYAAGADLDQGASVLRMAPILEHGGPGIVANPVRAAAHYERAAELGVEGALGARLKFKARQRRDGADHLVQSKKRHT